MSVTTEEKKVIEEMLKQTTTASESENLQNIVGQISDNSLSDKILNALENNQEGDGNLYIELFKDILVYDHSEQQWYKYNGKHWQKDAIDGAFALIRKVVDLYGEELQRQAKLRVEAARSCNDVQVINAAKKEKEIEKRITDLQTEPRRRKVLKFAAAGPDSLGIDGQERDQNPMFFACSNGVIDLNNGQFRAGLPTDYIRTAPPIEWKGINTPAPIFTKSLFEIFDGNEELISYIQRLFGYGITGLTVDHILPIFWGQGRNGKGVLLETISHVMGPLAACFQTEVILKQNFSKSSSSPTPDIMALKGKRLVWSSETGDGRYLNEDKVKTLSGGDTLTGRFLYSNKEDFKPTHKMILLTNFKPHLSGEDYAIWHRVHLVPFRISFVDEPQFENERERNPYLLAALKKEDSGILAWLVRGCLEWQKNGLNPPDIVRVANAEYRFEEDIFGHFLRDCCFRSPDAETQASALYKIYLKWCKINRHQPYSSTRFGLTMSKRFEKIKKDRVWYKDIGINNSFDSPY